MNTNFPTGENVKEFIIYWLDGKQETIHGFSISDAFMVTLNI